MALPPCSIPALVAALRDGLRDRPGLADVFVTAAPVPPDALQPRTIRLGGTDSADQAIRSFGTMTVAEDYTIGGTLWHIAPGLWGDDAIDAALAGAFALYAEVEAFLREGRTAPRVGGTVQHAEVALTRYRPEIFDTGTGVVLDFGIRVRNELHP